MTTHISSSKNTRLTVQSLLAASVLGLGIAAVVAQLDQSNLAVGLQGEVAEQPSEALELTVYNNVMLLRRRAGLEDTDLAAMGLSQAECESVLGRLVFWCETNEDALARVKQALYKAERELEQQNRLVRIGQASASQLRDTGGKANAVVKAQLARQSLMNSGAEHAMQGAAGKTAAWMRALEIKGEATPGLGYIPTMSVDRLSRVRAEAKQKSVDLEQALSQTERRELKDVRERIKSQLPGVRAAEKVALPLPVELRVTDGVLTSE